MCKIILMFMVTVCILIVTGCSTTSGVVGEYHGTAGSYLKINKDGSCIYAEDDATGTGTGTWYVENDVIYIEVDNLDYVIFGDIDDDKEGILLEAKARSWNDEFFEKE